MMQMLVRAVWSCSRYGDNKVFLRLIVSPQGLCFASDATQCELSASALLLGGIPERVQRRPNMRTKLIMLSLAAALITIGAVALKAKATNGCRYPKPFGSGEVLLTNREG